MLLLEQNIGYEERPSPNDEQDVSCQHCLNKPKHFQLPALPCACLHHVKTEATQTA